MQTVSNSCYYFSSLVPTTRKFWPFLSTHVKIPHYIYDSYNYYMSVLKVQKPIKWMKWGFPFIGPLFLTTCIVSRRQGWGWGGDQCAEHCSLSTPWVCRGHRRVSHITRAAASPLMRSSCILCSTYLFSECHWWSADLTTWLLSVPGTSGLSN